MVCVPGEDGSAALTVCLNTDITLVTVTQATNKGLPFGSRAPLRCVKVMWSNPGARCFSVRETERPGVGG